MVATKLASNLPFMLLVVAPAFFTTLRTREMTLVLKNTLYAEYRENATYTKMTKINMLRRCTFIFSPHVTILYRCSVSCVN